jgi:hypothetical protein
MITFRLNSLSLDTLKQGEQLILPKGLLLVAHEPSSVNTTPGPHIRGNTLRAYSIGNKEVDLLLPGTARYLIFYNIIFLPALHAIL